MVRVGPNLFRGLGIVGCFGLVVALVYAGTVSLKTRVDDPSVVPTTAAWRRMTAWVNGRAEPTPSSIADLRVFARQAQAEGAPAWFPAFAEGAAAYADSHRIVETIAADAKPGDALRDLDRALTLAYEARGRWRAATVATLGEPSGDWWWDSAIEDSRESARRNADRARSWAQQLLARRERAAAETPDHPAPPAPRPPDPGAEFDEAPPDRGPAALGTGEDLAVARILELLQRRIDEGARVRRAQRDRRAAGTEKDW